MIKLKANVKKTKFYICLIKYITPSKKIQILDFSDIV